MDKKIMLAVDENFIDDYIGWMWDSSMQQPHLNNEIKKLNEEIEQAKADAEVEIARIKKELADEILKEIENCGCITYYNHGIEVACFEFTPTDLEQLKAKYIGEK